MNRLVHYFVRGLLMLVPVYFTGYILYRAFLYVDGLIPLTYTFADTPVRLWGLGVVVVLAVVVGVGFIGSTFLAVPVLGMVEAVIARLPLVRIIYASLKDLTSAFVGDKKKFNHPVLVQLDPSQEIFRLGFLTQEDLNELHLPDCVAVYLPQSYAFAGDLFIVPRKNVKPIQSNAAVVMKFIVSGGVSRE